MYLANFAKIYAECKLMENSVKKCNNLSFSVLLKVQRQFSEHKAHISRSSADSLFYVFTQYKKVCAVPVSVCRTREGVQDP